MNQSPEIKDLAKALAAAQSSLSAAKKDAVNPHFKNKYATLQSVWDAAREVLAPNGLSVVQTFGQTDGSRMDITTTLLHTSGQWISGTLSMTPQRADPQGIGSAITYGRRYGLSSILGIVTDDDDDGNAASQPARASNEVHAVTSQTVTRPFPGQSSSHTTPPQTGRHLTPVKTTEMGTAFDSWRTVIVPPFIKKYAGKTLGDMDEKSLLWWAENYQPKEYKGAIQQKDLDLREALTQAQRELQPGQNPAPDDGGEIPF